MRYEDGEDIMNQSDDKKTYVRVSDDNMTAYIYLALPESGKKYSMAEVIACLNNNNVNMGIDEKVIDYIISREIYLREIPVAKGKPVIDGIDGFYDYKFRRVLDKKPLMNEDGSVDFWSISSVENVFEGQVIAVYNPALEGENGYTVNGKTLTAKRGKELVALKGKGFQREEDKVTYTSLIDGKIEVMNERINISEVFELYGNADVNVGNIDFPGDVIIHGNVCSGVTIKAGGSLTVDGSVEAAYITAKKDIIFRSGMQGGYKAQVVSGGNIYAKFFEHTNIEAEGYIEAGIIMNSYIKSCEKLMLAGKRAVIVGGEIYAIQSVDSMGIGNQAELPTQIVVGVSEDTFSKKKLLEKKIQITQEHIDKVSEGIRNFEQLVMKDSGIQANDPRKAQLIRAKINDSVVLSKATAELEKINGIIERGKGAYVRVGGFVYPRVKICIDEEVLIIQSAQVAVEFFKREKGIMMKGLAVKF